MPIISKATEPCRVIGYHSPMTVESLTCTLPMVSDIAMTPFSTEVNEQPTTVRSITAVPSTCCALKSPAVMALATWTPSRCAPMLPFRAFKLNAAPLSIPSKTELMACKEMSPE